MRNILRNILIILLFILTVYQISILWFDNFSLSSITSAFNGREITATKTMDYILDRIIVNLGDNKIAGKTGDIYASEYKKTFDNAIVEAVNNGDKADMGEFSWSNILNNRAVIYEYSCVFDGKNISYIFGSSVNEDKTGDIAAFDNIIILPDTGDGRLTTIFYNSLSNSCTARVIKSSDTVSAVYEAGAAFANDSGSVCISSVQSGFVDIFSKNVFIDTGMEYPSVRTKGLYADESMAEKNAEDFFDNPVTKWSSADNDSLTYSDENTVVKYYRTSNVFEYSNYRASAAEDGSLSANYIAAVNTVSQDSFVKNEYYLSDYSYENGRYTFKFNYKINDRRLAPDNSLKNKTGMDSFMEVTTELGKTLKYKKYSYCFEKDDERRRVEYDFVAAVDRVYKDKMIDDIDLRYMADDKNSVRLNWIIAIGDESYMEAAERE